MASAWTRGVRLMWWAAVAAAAAGALVWSVPSQRAAAGTGDVQRGEELYAANCAMCHGEEAAGMGGMHPALRGVVDRLTLEGVEVTIRNGRDTTPPMPAFGDELGDAEVADVIAYLGSLPPGPRDFGPGRMMDEGMMDRMMGRGRAGGLGTLLAVLAAVVLVGVAAVVLVVTLTRRPSGAGAGGSAREILDRRYAAGELSREEYVRRREDLEA